MERSPILAVLPSNTGSNPQLYYRGYCRPKLASLLAATGLDTTYRTARGASLIDATGHEVTDFVGGFGAALLGHNPPELK